MKTEFTTFRVKRGMESVANEWMKTLQERRSECVESLERERMHFEAIFRTERDGRLYLSWFSVQGEGGAPVKGSPHEIDQLHVEFWLKCIEKEFAPEHLEHVVSFLPPEVDAVVRNRDSRQGFGE